MSVSRVAAAESRWIRWYAQPSPPRFRVVCLPPAGSSASFYRTWASAVPRDVSLAALQYPGRENRIGEPPLDDLTTLADRAAAALATLDGTPLVLFGHSLGAVVAYEIALRLPRVMRLLVSGCVPPHIHRRRARRTWDDDSILEDLRRLGGRNHAVLDQPSLRALILPAVRADYLLTEGYVPRPDSKLTCPVTAFYGRQDPEVTPDEMREWQLVTSGPFRTWAFDGDHFFPIERKDQVVSAIVDDVDRTDVPARP
jgi:pyochelin biosynthetic protein PchC